MAIQITPMLNQLRQRIGDEGFGEPKRIDIDNVGDKSFSDMVNEAINSVDQAQKTANQNVENIVMGKSDNIHEAMISMEKAQLSFQLMMEVRNKAVETYKELSRMQI
ncbi:MAG: flagellar hook-basal body complex protein FliE [Balneolaceae bacterium]|jgi:flagellar hook-basal body complex protein FliE